MLGLGGQTNIYFFKKQVETKEIGFSYNERYTCLKISNKIIIYSNEAEILVASLDLNDGIPYLRLIYPMPVFYYLHQLFYLILFSLDTQLYNFMKHTELHCL